MAHAFRARKGEIVGKLDADERFLLVHLMDQVRALVEGMSPGLPELTGDPLADAVASIEAEPRVAEEIEDPALRRLFPDARRDDPQAAGEFRRLTETGLRQRKVDQLSRAREVLSRPGTGRKGEDVHLTRAEAAVVTVALTDVRLVLGERLELRTDEDADALQRHLDEAGPDDAKAQSVALYDFLTWVQETLATALVEA
ncbi:DUF2017 domain-containing protein [Arsenicicoccus piscis]|uniref:DUF2017 domain-containing protein n=1 Tax=Arsenicicoccus piscis TaxID=673954 RepID=A0ABQ6HJQ0_9MICO|nr:DUF2017 domain-containing protein [Arsenicicoccus piscis]MCH8628346.1 DUF2017 domain-containing protein [Arsenicicoccus piscis]GMA18616.1 hypothetical protein GCM10025862_06370 [Arsenicicoccus piscis]